MVIISRLEAITWSNNVYRLINHKLFHYYLCKRCSTDDISVKKPRRRNLDLTLPHKAYSSIVSFRSRRVTDD